MSAGGGLPGRGDPVTCGFCGRDFVEDPGQPACQACPLANACHFVRCPHCGYDNPAKPSWLDRIGAWMRDHAST